MLSSLFDKYPLFLLILMRMSGAILINPLFGRKNIPNNVKAGFTLMVSVILTVSTPIPIPALTSIFEFFFKALMEFAVGYAISMIMNMFFSTIFVAADLMDMQLGIGMSKVFDPGSNISAPVTGSIYNVFLIILFFVSNGHITFFKLLSDSLVAIPCGSDIQIAGAAYAIVGIMGTTLTLALKFALPIVAIEFVTELGMGVLTRAVPHVNIFSVGIQLKLFVGILVLVLLTPLFGSFCDELYSRMFAEITGVLRLIKASG